MRARDLARLVAALLAVSLAACDGATGTDGSFDMSPSTTTLSVAQGGFGTLTLTFTRADFSGPITLAAEGLPAGVTATFSPNPASGTSTTVQLTAAASTAPGSATVTFRATGEGVAERTATVALQVNVAGNFTLGSLGVLTLAQGGADRGTILVNRSDGFSGAVALTLTGAPAGLTATLDAASTTGNAISLTLGASASLPPGSYTLTATGSSAGVANQETAITVNVIAAPATASLTMTYCAGSMPAFLAYKNEGSAWQAIAASGNTFTFDATERLAVAVIFLSSDQSSKQGRITWGLRSEFAFLQGRDCPGARTVTGTVTGMSAAQHARIAMGPSTISPPATNSAPAFTLANVPDRVLDLVATLGITTASSFTPDKMIIRRNIDAAAASVAPLDFAAAEAFTFDQAVLTIGTAPAADLKTVATTYWTTNSTYGLLQYVEPSSATVTYFGVPLARQVAGDFHELYLDHYVQQSQVGRSLLSYFAAPGDRTEALGPFVNAPVVTTLTTTPYVRFRARLEAQAEYGGAVRILFRQTPTASDFRDLFLQVSAAYLGSAPSTWDLAIPDLSGLAGFNTSWMPTTGTQTLWQVLAFGGRTELLSDARPAAGDLLRYSDRTAQMAGTSLRADGERPARPALMRGQYFRR